MLYLISGVVGLIMVSAAEGILGAARAKVNAKTPPLRWHLYRGGLATDAIKIFHDCRMLGIFGWKERLYPWLLIPGVVLVAIYGVHWVRHGFEF